MALRGKYRRSLAADLVDIRRELSAAGIMHVGLCLMGGVIFAAAIGRVSRRVLMTTSLVS